MNTVSINYAINGVTKTVTLNEIHRFYEAYTYKAKDLIMVVSNNDEFYVSDEVLAEMLQGEIQSITLVSDTEGKALNVTLSDYPSIRDVRKEYDFGEGQIRIQLIFQRVFNKDISDNEEEEVNPTGF